MNLTIDDLTIEYRVIGEGEKTVVILEGWGTNMSVYDVVVNALSDRYRVVILDLPGFGQSTEPPKGWSVDDYDDFLLKFLQRLNINEASFVGHSYGGRMIIKLAARESTPVRIGKIVLVDSAGIIRAKSLKTRLRVLRYKVIKKIAELKISRFFYSEIIDEWQKKQGSADYRNASPIMKQCLVKAVNEDLTDLLPKIKNETLLIWGDKDTATPLSDGKRMNGLIEGSGLAIIEGGDHYSFLCDPKAFTRIINAFL